MGGSLHKLKTGWLGLHNMTHGTDILEKGLDPANETPRGSAVNIQIRNAVDAIIGDRVIQGSAGNRRVNVRHSYPHIVQLTPVSNGLQVPEQSIAVVGKQLSVGGFDFFHSEPLPYRRMIATLGLQSENPVHFLIDLTWCRFIGDGWYGNGGRFVKVMTGESRLPPRGEGEHPLSEVWPAGMISDLNFLEAS